MNYPGLHWAKPSSAWGWWHRNDTRLVEVVHAITGEAIDPSDLLETKGGVA